MQELNKILYKNQYNYKFRRIKCFDRELLCGICDRLVSWR